MLHLYKALEAKVLSDKTSGTEKARCAEIAASIALDILKLESEGIRAVKQLSLAATAETAIMTAAKKNANLNNFRNECC